MHRDLTKLIDQYLSGRITKHECVNKFPDHFEYTFGPDELRSVVEELPDEIRLAVESQISKAPITTEDWARFRTRRGTGGIDQRIAPADAERAAADDQAKYYRFVIAWRKAFRT